jgi:hypothetical protein
MVFRAHLAGVGARSAPLHQTLGRATLLPLCAAHFKARFGLFSPKFAKNVLKIHRGFITIVYAGYQKRPIQYRRFK